MLETDGKVRWGSGDGMHGMECMGRLHGIHGMNAWDGWDGMDGMECMGRIHGIHGMNAWDGWDEWDCMNGMHGMGWDGCMGWNGLDLFMSTQEKSSKRSMR